MRNTFRIAWITIRELIYERVFYILLGFGVLSIGLSLLLGQLTYAEQAKLTLDFMLAGIEISMVLFAIFMGIGLFKKELIIGSAAMVLSKPISRSSFLMGKYLGQLAIQGVVILCMVGITILLYSTFERPDGFVSILQSGMMIFLEVGVLTAIAYFFAVNAGTITAAVVTLSLFGLGHLQTPLSHTMGSDMTGGFTWRVATGLIPDLEIFNMRTLASYGHSIAWGEMGWAVLYALCCATFFLLMATVCFGEKDILT